MRACQLWKMTSWYFCNLLKWHKEIGAEELLFFCLISVIFLAFSDLKVDFLVAAEYPDPPNFCCR